MKHFIRTLKKNCIVYTTINNQSDGDIVTSEFIPRRVYKSFYDCMPRCGCEECEQAFLQNVVLFWKRSRVAPGYLFIMTDLHDLEFSKPPRLSRERN